MNELVIQPGERILKEARDVIWLKSWFKKPRGRLCFTTQRLILELPKQIAYTATQALANDIRNHVPIDVPRDSLEAVELGRHRKNDNVLVVRTRDEEFKLLFIGDHAKEWEGMLRQAMFDDKVALESVLERLKPKQNPPPYR
jgi:hypothetical protein